MSTTEKTPVPLAPATDEAQGEVLEKTDLLDNVPQETVDDVLNPDSYSDAYFRKLRFKADLWLLPIMWFCK